MWILHPVDDFLLVAAALHFVSIMTGEHASRVHVDGRRGLGAGYIMHPLLRSGSRTDLVVPRYVSGRAYQESPYWRFVAEYLRYSTC
ncbi:hypothetical protein L227DRAFT_581548 [Lentinus tigrinus ALCF2SS1-6]|uniref:Uncharacterized protein n=1 Tax=Lentinus tigrinus ALCF2SS1-6 TaxID=1328759 RepID=A0A5C2RPE5_9APHY|nr:hypothetical protein L227DRAFT_581548 [Lentinus tigrinus ALCF2SS1-6]